MEHVNWISVGTKIALIACFSPILLVQAEEQPELNLNCDAEIETFCGADLKGDVLNQCLTDNLLQFGERCQKVVDRSLRKRDLGRNLPSLESTAPQNGVDSQNRSR